MRTRTRTFEGLKVHYRPGIKNDPSSDEQALEEVLVRRAYRRTRSGFDVEQGERWLDLGANIGAFALYCRLRGAQAVCYEPEPGCFGLLQKNAKGFKLINAAVTAHSAEFISFSKSSNPQNNYRNTECVVRGYVPIPPVRNVYGGVLTGQKFDGVKMDIEGSEGPLIDDWLLPHCSKLVMEYHTSRDPEGAHLVNRLAILKQHFEHIHYPTMFKKLERYYEEPGADLPKGFPPRYDQLIFCWGPK